MEMISTMGMNALHQGQVMSTHTRFIARKAVQIAFSILVITIGIQFYLFVFQAEKGILPGIDRPPGVEAFLPISALVSLKHLVFTGTINRVHPSGLVIFLIVCSTALLAKKGFCSWVCPFGLLSEFLARIHRRIFSNGLTLPVWSDMPLRSLKYLLAGFFIYQIFFKMSRSSIEQFIHSPYNRFADIKMLTFFTQISQTTVIVLSALFVLSILIRHFWCRYLCPYGAILGIIGLFSAGRITRNPSHCTTCGKCEKNCPSHIPIRQKTQIHSTECTACLSCVKACPENQAIGFSFFRIPTGPVGLALVIVCLFAAGIATAKITGNWQNDIPKKAYVDVISQDKLRSYGHP